MERLHGRTACHSEEHCNENRNQNPRPVEACRNRKQRNTVPSCIGALDFFTVTSDGLTDVFGSDAWLL